MAISIPERSIGDVTILEVPSEIVFYEGAALLRTRISELLDEGRVKLVLDLGHVTYLDSFGVGVIAGKYVSARGRGGDLKLLRPSPRCVHVLKTARLMDIFESFDEEEQALRSFDSGART